MNRRARIACGLIAGALAGALTAYYLPQLWWYYANGLSDTSGGPKGVEPMPFLAPFGALIGAGIAGWKMASRPERTPQAHAAVVGERPQRDRLPLIVLPVMFVVIAIAGVATVFGLAKLTPNGAARSADALPTSSTESTAAQEPPRATPGYAGLRPDRAATFAAVDFAKLLGVSGSGIAGGVVATADRKVSRTRCFHSSHWSPYWRVTFAGSSPIFESRRQALVFCNRNEHIIETTAPIPH